MNTTLKARLDAITQRYVSEVNKAVRDQVRQDVMAHFEDDDVQHVGSNGKTLGSAHTDNDLGSSYSSPSPARGRARNDDDDVDRRVLDRIMDTLKTKERPAKAADLAGELGIDTKEVSKALKQGVEEGSLKKKGQARGTTYQLR